MKFCYNPSSLRKNNTLLNKFRVLYESGFPDINERENFDVILKRVSGDRDVSEPHSVILMTTDESSDSEVTGGLIADWYEPSQSLHLIYLIISEKHRKKNIARKLINDGVKLIIDHVRNENETELKNVFFESNIPWKTKKENDNFDAETRLKIFSKLGARWIDIPYVQPALDPTKETVDNLFLLSFSQFNANQEKILASEILDFLRDLYMGLGVNVLSQDVSYKSMLNALEETKDNDGNITLDRIPYEKGLILEEKEKPSFYFDQTYVTIHVIEENIQTSKRDISCSYFSSFEKDLLNFQNQKSQPINSVLMLPNQTATLILPKSYKYTSEGTTHKIIPKLNKLNVIVSLSYTQVHLSNNRIWHLTVKPNTDEPGFTEYDLIKLVTLFGSTQENSTVKNRIKIELNAETYTAIGLIKYLAHLQPKVNLSFSETGLVQIDTQNLKKPAKKNLELFYNAFVSNERKQLDPRIELFAQTICGIILGIFDFKRMDYEEIYDTIQPVMSTNSSFTVLCRGTLFKISHEDGLMETVADNIVVNPYLLIPSTVLAHNEHILTKAKDKLNSALSENNKMGFKRLEQDQATINELINYKYLESLFQYPSEKLIIKSGNKIRGLAVMKSNVNSRMKELTDKIDSKRNNFSLITDSIIALVLFLIPIWEFYKGLAELFGLPGNFYVIGSASLIITLAYLLIMKRKFK